MWGEKKAHNGNSQYHGGSIYTVDFSPGCFSLFLNIVLEHYLIKICKCIKSNHLRKIIEERLGENNLHTCI